MFLEGPEINPTSFRRLNRDWANSHRFPRPWTQKLNKWWTFCWNLMGKMVKLFEEPGKGVTVSGADNMLKVTNELKWIEQMQLGSPRTRERGNPPEWKRKIMGTQLSLKGICDVPWRVVVLLPFHLWISQVILKKRPFNNKRHSCLVNKSGFEWESKQKRKATNYPSSHNHGSVKNGSLSPIGSFPFICCSFPLNQDYGRKATTWGAFI